MWIYDAVSHCKRWVSDAIVRRWHEWAIKHPHAHAVIHNTLVGVPVCLRAGAIIVAGATPAPIPEYYGPPFNGIGGIPFAGEAAYPPTFGYPSGGYAEGFGGFGGLPGLFGGLGGFGGGGVASLSNTGNLLAANLPIQNAPVNQPTNTPVLTNIAANMPAMPSTNTPENISPGNMQPGDMPPNNEQTPPINTIPTPPVNTPEGASWMFLATPLIFCLRRRK